MSTEREIRQKIQQIRAEFKAFFKQRDDVVDGLLVALLARCHILLLGPPGTAKSLLAESTCRAMAGAAYFQTCLNKFITWRDLACAGVQVVERAEGGVRFVDFRYTESGLLKAAIAFLDEIFKASGASANSLLPLLNERTYSINAGDVRKAPLQTVVGASNEMPSKEDDHLQAFSDRFLLRYEVPYLTTSQGGDTDFVEMLAMSAAQPVTTLDASELEAARQFVAQVTVDRSILWLINAMQARLDLEHHIRPSDRRYRESLGAIQAYAWLNGHSKVASPDLRILEHILWVHRDRASQEAARTVVGEVSGARGLGKAMEWLDEAHRLHQDAVRLLDEAERILPLDDRLRATRERAQLESLAQERKLEEVAAKLAGEAQRHEASENATTIRTFRNQVNVWRKQLLRKRGVENAFLEVEQWPASSVV